MKLCTMLQYVGGFEESVSAIAEQERAGLDLVWVPEAYGFDAPSLLGFLAARTQRVQLGAGILPIYTRTPTLIAMTAAGIDALSGGRFNLGLGASGPQVIEGFHGVPYRAPIGRTHDVIEVCRRVWAREAPLEFSGDQVTVPLPAELGTGLGKALKIITRPVRSQVPIWVAALGERNVEATAAEADGWLPTLFVPERAQSVWGRALAAGAARRDPALGPLMVSAGGPLAIGDGPEVVAVRASVRDNVALYVGGMGARGRNFYNDLVRRYGYERAAERIATLYLDGKKDAAAAAVPDALIEGLTLCGPLGFVRDRIAAYREAGVTHLQVQPMPTNGQRAVDLIEMVKELLS